MVVDRISMSRRLAPPAGSGPLVRLWPTGAAAMTAAMVLSRRTLGFFENPQKPARCWVETFTSRDLRRTGSHVTCPHQQVRRPRPRAPPRPGGDRVVGRRV